MFPKTKRIVDEKLLKRVRARPCDACGKCSTKEYPNQACHIRSKGAFGDDIENNLLTMCPLCHHNQHLFGWKRFLSENEFLRQKLAQKGWRIGNYNKLIQY